MNNIGVIGMGVMGKNLALNFSSKNIKTSIYNRTYDKSVLAKQEDDFGNIFLYNDLKEFVESLEKPRKIIIMVSAGNAVDETIKDLEKYIECEDIIIDAGNSFYLDTQRRYEELEKKNINYVGLGVSGGEEGARKGPAMMIGSSQKVYNIIREYLEKISAKAKDGETCAKYSGNKGAGHFVKMVHNAIEYADMEIIAEFYSILKDAYNYSLDEISEIFLTINDGFNESYLLDITCQILKEKVDGEYLLPMIKDAAKQKGTGKWTQQFAVDIGFDSSILMDALNARILSSSPERELVRGKFENTSEFAKIKMDLDIASAMSFCKILNYTQGFLLMHYADKMYNWDLSLSNIAAGFRNGCIIRGNILEYLMKHYAENGSEIPFVLFKEIEDLIKVGAKNLRKLICIAVEREIKIPCILSAISYFDGLKEKKSSTNLIQAQRDFFGAHTFEIENKEGVYHHEWSK